MTRSFVTAALTAALLLVGGPSWAGDDQAAAREIFKAARAAFGRGEYRAAALAFESANQRAPNGGTLYNAAIAWASAGEPARAADALERALATGELPKGKATDAKARLEKLAAKLGVLDIRTDPPARVSVAHVEDSTTPVRLHVSPGEHVLSISWPGRGRQSERVSVAAGETRSLALQTPQTDAGAAPVPVTREQPVAATDTAADTTDSSQRTWGYVSLATGAVAAGIGSYLLVQGLSARDEYEDSGRDDLDARDRAVSLRTWGNVAVIGGGLLAAGGVVLVLTAPEDGHVRARLAPGSAMVTGRF